MYLERIKKVERANCPACGHPRETIQHFIFDCPSYSYERWVLLKCTKKRELKMKDLLNCEDMVIPLANYIQATGRFDLEGAGEKNRRRGEGEGGGVRNDRSHRSIPPQHEGRIRQSNQE